jgi:glyoxylase-like metal-dependent hydrolase (beta-lactamase superfamily II)
MDFTTEEVFAGVFEMRTSYGRDTAGLFTDGAFPHAVWYIPGPHAALLDPGPTVVAEGALRAIAAMGHDVDEIEYVIPSHIHVDHAGGAGWLVAQLPRAKAVFQRRGAPYITDVARLADGTRAVFGPEWESIFGALLPVPAERLVVVDDVDDFELGGRPYQTVFLPGHSLDHIGVLDVENRALYSGHGAGNYLPPRFMPDTPMTLPYFDVEAALASIRRMRELDPRYLLPVHTGFLPTNPRYALDAVERVTIELGELIQEAMAAGRTEEQMDVAVRTYMFAKPERADRSYLPTVRAYVTYYQRLARNSAQG